MSLNVTYFNLSDDTDPANNRTCASSDEIEQVLAEGEPSRKRPFVFELVTENKGRLTVGIAEDCGFAFYSAQDIREPSVNAVDPEAGGMFPR